MAKTTLAQRQAQARISLDILLFAPFSKVRDETKLMMNRLEKILHNLLEGLERIFSPNAKPLPEVGVQPYHGDANDDPHYFG